MNIQQAYNTWADNYDTVLNLTRDIEAKAIRTIVSRQNYENILEVGCGTGKNTGYLGTKAKQLTAIDFSPEMLSKAKEKNELKNVEFIQVDITGDWNFTSKKFDLVTCSLILEHIKDIDFIFQQANKILNSGGQFYIGELHPFKQYLGSKAKFETAGGTFEVECFVHHISDFFKYAERNNFVCVDLREWFDGDDKTTVPRVVSFLFEKK